MKRDNKYNIKVIMKDGVACISLVGNGNHYSTNGKNEPEGKVYGTFKDKKYKRGTILRKFGLWERKKINGVN